MLQERMSEIMCTSVLTPGNIQRKSPKCKSMQALQRALSIAQQVGVGIEELKQLIATHKNNCDKCMPKGK